MARINAKLFERLKEKLGVGQRRVYGLIDAKVSELRLPRHLAAIVLATEHGINISRFATDEELGIIRQAAISSAPPPVVAPAPSSPKIGRKVSGAKPRPLSRPRQLRRGTSVFVVHGRNESARKGVFDFLRALGLQPIEWNQAIKRTRKPTPYVGEILDTAFRDAAAVVIVLTPDDEARLRTAYRKSMDPPYEKRLTGQPRPNVLFEAGMAFGRNPDSTVLVQLGDVRPFSDVAGRHIVHLSNNPTSRQEFATKLANAGCNVDTSGTDWLDAGDLRI